MTYVKQIVGAIQKTIEQAGDFRVDLPASQALAALAGSLTGVRYNSHYLAKLEMCLQWIRVTQVVMTGLGMSVDSGAGQEMDYAARWAVTEQAACRGWIIDEGSPK